VFDTSGDFLEFQSEQAEDGQALKSHNMERKNYVNEFHGLYTYQVYRLIHVPSLLDLNDMKVFNADLDP